MEENKKTEESLIQKMQEGISLSERFSPNKGRHEEKTPDFISTRPNLLGGSRDVTKFTALDLAANAPSYALLKSYQTSPLINESSIETAAHLKPTTGMAGIQLDENGLIQGSILAREEKEREEKEKSLAEKIEKNVFKKMEEATIKKEEPKIMQQNFDPMELVENNPIGENIHITNFAEKISNRGGYVGWHCASCGQFLKQAPRLMNFKSIENCYGDFARGKYVSCPKCYADNFFIIQKNVIIFCSQRSLNESVEPLLRFPLDKKNTKS